MQHDFSLAEMLITDKLSFLKEMGFDPPLCFVGSGRTVEQDKEVQSSEMLTVLYASRQAKRQVIIEFDCGVMKLAPFVRAVVVHHDGARNVKRFQMSHFLERKCHRKDAYKAFSGFWSGLPRKPSTPAEETTFIVGAMEACEPVFKNELKETLLGHEWPKMDMLPY